MAAPFEKSVTDMEDLLAKSKKIAKGDTMAAAGIDTLWLTAYAEIARRCRDDKEFGLTRYPYEAGPSVSAFIGGFFEHKQWPIRLNLEKQSSMRTIAMYEANYINASGYWLAFNEAAIQLRQEALSKKDTTNAERYDVWAQMGVRYALRVVGLRTEFYKLAADDPPTAKLLMSGFERRMDMPAADDMIESMEKMESHLQTQMMKAVATLKASNAGKKTGGGRGGTADGN